MIFFFLILILLIGFSSTFLSRGNLVLLLLLPASEFLGFVDPMQLAVKGLFDIHALIAAIVLIGIAASFLKLKQLIKAELKIPFLVFFLFWVYGVLYPWFTNDSSLFYSLKASKEYITIFSYIAVFLFMKTKKEIDLGWRYLIWLGVYYSIVEFVGQFTGPILQEVVSYTMRREESIFTKIYLPFWPVLLIAMFHTFFEIYLKINKPYFRAGLTSLGLMLTFFRSYLVASIVVIPAVLMLTGQGMTKVLTRTTVLLSSIFLALVIITFTIGGGIEAIYKISDKFLISAITEVSEHSGGALIGREKVSENREKFLKKNPLFGYGFIDKDSALGKRLVVVIRGDNLGFIDRGILDIPIKFGYIGFVLFILNIIYLIISLLRMSKKFKSEIFKVRCMALSSILIVSIIVLPVHAPFTYSFALLPIGIGLGLIDKELSLLAREKSTE